MKNEDKIADSKIAYYHLPGLFEFYDFYNIFLELYYSHREYFYDWCEIGSIYGAPAECIWGGGRVGFGYEDPDKVLALMNKFGISARLTFSNSLLEKKHLTDKKCNLLCEMFSEKSIVKSGVIIHSDLLMEYIKNKYPNLYFVSSTTKVLTEFEDLKREISRDDFSYVVPDFRLNRQFEMLDGLLKEQRAKLEFLCNECCSFSCSERKSCYENVSRKSLGDNCEDHYCTSSDAGEGYRFSRAMKNKGFIGIEDIRNIYLPMGFNNFKIEGRSLGNAMVLEFLLYYMTKPEYQLLVREEIYLDSALDLF